MPRTQVYTAASRISCIGSSYKIRTKITVVAIVSLPIHGVKSFTTVRRDQVCTAKKAYLSTYAGMKTRPHISYVAYPHLRNGKAEAAMVFRAAEAAVD